MIAVVRKFSISTKGETKPFPVVYVQENDDGKLFYCAVHPINKQQLFIEAEKVTAIEIDQ